MFRKTYEFPAQRQTAAIPDLVTITAHPNLEGTRILVADDERDARQMIQLALESCGAKVHAAYSADEAASLAGKYKFDVIVTDLAMPGGDGFSLLRRLRLRGDRTPAIALSAMRGSDIEKEVSEAGFIQHVDKPIEMSYLASAVADVIRTGKKES
jgi:CheY-like chemotaxis protein